MLSEADKSTDTPMRTALLLDNFRLVASAIGLRSVSVYPAAEQDTCWTDGEAIFLSPQLSYTELLDACIAQAAFIRGGGLEIENISRFIGRPKAAKKYFAYEVVRVITTDARFLPRSLEARSQAWQGVSEGSSSADESAKLAFSDKTCAPDLPSHFGKFRPARLWVRRRSARFLNANQVHASATQSEMEIFDEDEETESVFGRAMRMFSSPLSAGDFSKTLQEILGLGRSPGTSDDDASDGGSSILGANSMMMGQAAEDAEAISGFEPERETPRLQLISSQRFPEWDSNISQYKRDWTHVHVIEPVFSRSHTQNVNKSLPLLRALRFVGADAARHAGETEGEEFDIERLVRVLTERGHGPQRDDLFIARRKTRRDLSLCILVDSSHSTGDAPDGEPVLDKLKSIAGTLAGTMQALGARVAIQGFHSWGRHNVRMIEIKRFSEPFSGNARTRLSALEPAGLTRMGAVIRAATRSIMEKGGARYKLGVLLTDGFAYDDQYEGSYAEQDALMALKEAHEKGVAFVCLAVGGEQDGEVLKKLFGNTAYMSCSTLALNEARLRRLIEHAFAKTKRMQPAFEALSNIQ